MRCISPKISRSAGFTLVEVMVIAPVVILAIAGLVALIIVLTGDVLRVKGSNDLVYNTQNALSQIEQDVKGTIEFRQTSYTPTSPQGQADNAVAFDTISQTTTHLILRSIATSKNPDSQDRKLIYKQSGGTCSTTPYTFDVVYFTKVDPTSGINSLWRRIIFGNTTDAGTPCTGTTPWQAPSCTPGYTNTTVCKSEDALLLENVTAATVQYLNAAGTQINTTTPNAGSAVKNPNDAAGTTNASSAEVTLTTLNTVAGREGTYTGSIISSAPSKSLGSGGGGGGGGNVITFNYTGAYQTWQAPSGVTSIQIECWGAQGAMPPTGGGGYAKGTLAVTPGQTLYIYVGQAGGFAGGTGMQLTSTTFNGGGRGTTYNGTEGGGSGGGASDARTSTAVSTRVIVAGGGGSGYAYSGAGNPGGGNGGGTNGSDGTDYPGYPGSAGRGGTQSAGGNAGAISNPASPGTLGLGGNSPANNYGGGGGGGYYGGGGGDNTAGGGGSSYIGGVTSGTTTAGIQSGNGKIVITY